jgi:hypothetical protein
MLESNRRLQKLIKMIQEWLDNHVSQSENLE